MKRIIPPLLLLSLSPFTVSASPSRNLTIYGNGIALVRETRPMTLTAGDQRVKIEGFSPRTIPSSIVATPDSPWVRLRGQRFDATPLSPATLLERYVGRDVLLVTDDPRTGEEKRVTARVVSTTGGTIYRVGDDLVVTPPGRVIFPPLPDDLPTRPTCILSLQSDRPVDSSLELQWLTGGIGWSADYRLLLDDHSDRARFDSLVTIDNQSGTPWDQVSVSLVAGEPNRIASPPPRIMKAMAREASEAYDGRPPEPVGDFHLYRLTEPVSIGEGGVEQFPLFPPTPVTITRRYRVEPPPFSPGARSPQTLPVSSIVEFVNHPPTGPGLPLPRGTVRVYATDRDGSPIFLGEDRIDHTPDGETVRVTVGRAFDIVAERTETGVKKISPDTREISVQTTIRNHRPEPVTVTYVEPLAGESTLVSSSIKPSRTTAREMTFDIPVTANGSTTLTATIQSRF